MKTSNLHSIYFVSIFILLTLSNFAVSFEMNGMTFTGEKYCNVPYDSEKSFSSLKHLRSTGANWVAFTVTWYQETTNANDLFPIYGQAVGTNGYYIYESATTESLVNAIKYAKKLGFKVFLKPHIDVLTDQWRGSINAQDKQLWFTSYTDYILLYAQTAEDLGVEMFSVSTELNTMERVTDDWAWPALISKVRQVYKGKLTLAANHDGAEFGFIHWDLLDYIGSDAYYDIFIPNSNDIKGIVNKWQRTKNALYNLSKRWNKRVIFTELGYCKGQLSYQCTRDKEYRPKDQVAMRNYYEAVFETFGNDDWFMGVFWWNWTPDFAYGGKDDNCMTPQWKPAESVLRQYYSELKPRPQRPSYAPVCQCTL